ncbi:MAG TPA: hypothetical protein VIR82_24715 [Bradyrhizobium sp.]
MAKKAATLQLEAATMRQEVSCMALSSARLPLFGALDAHEAEVNAN